MEQRALNLKPKFKLWLSTNEAEGVFGDGKWRLLKAVDQHGSLKAAAEALGMSYRKAWGDIKKAEDSLGVALIQRQHGGKSGGSARLTETGREWVSAYSLYRQSIEEAVSRAYKKYIPH